MIALLLALAALALSILNVKHTRKLRKDTEELFAKVRALEGQDGGGHGEPEPFATHDAIQRAIDRHVIELH